MTTKSEGRTSLRHMIGTPVQKVLRRAGYEITSLERKKQRGLPPDFTSEEIDDLQLVRPYTMTEPERVISLMRSTRYVVEHQIPGDIVECGVWKGGSMMAVARMLMRLGDTSRHLWLFDTYEGMSPPTEHDNTVHGETAEQVLGYHGEFLRSPVDDVKDAMKLTGYDPAKMSFIKGKVEDTIPAHGPERIALLRLDTDWYESTLHELNHFYPRLSMHGVLIIDDYGHWEGARRAVDEYIEKHRLQILLHRIDYTARFAVKTHEASAV